MIEFGMVNERKIEKQLAVACGKIPGDPVGELITTRDIPAGMCESGEPEASKIFFFITGDGIVSTGRSKKVRIEQGAAVVLPIGGKYLIEAYTKITLAVFTIDERVNYERIFRDMLSGRSVAPKNQPYILPMNDKLWIFITNTLSFLTDGLMTRSYQLMKIDEFFHIISAYYSDDIIVRFLAPLCSRTAWFAGTVYINWETAETLGELAAKTGLSLSGFSKRFKKIFGLSPYQWIMERKSGKIFEELARGEKSIRQLASEYGFYSVQHFGYYCKKRFGVTPGRIRQSGGEVT